MLPISGMALWQLELNRNGINNCFPTLREIVRQNFDPAGCKCGRDKRSKTVMALAGYLADGEEGQLFDKTWRGTFSEKLYSEGCVRAG